MSNQLEFPTRPNYPLDALSANDRKAVAHEDMSQDMTDPDYKDMVKRALDAIS